MTVNFAMPRSAARLRRKTNQQLLKRRAIKRQAASAPRRNFEARRAIATSFPPDRGRRAGALARDRFARLQELASICLVSAAIAGLCFHDLRHCAITKVAESEASDQTIMSIAGHLDRKMLEHYSHIRNAGKRKAIEAISSYDPQESARPERAARVQ